MNKMKKETILIKFKRTIREGFEAIRFFGWNVAVSKVVCIWSDESLKSVDRKNKAILAFLKKDCGELIDRYVSAENPNIDEMSNHAPVWVFWLQGKEKMPELIRICHQSIESFAGSHPIKLLDKDNIRDYVSFSDDVWNRVEKGGLKVQHLADMIRVQLIRKYGGLWLDASVFCHKEIPEAVFQKPVFSLKGELMPEFVSKNRWTTFLMGGLPGNVLCSFLDDFFMEWSNSRRPFIDYFMLDCAISLAYENIPAVRSELDLIPIADGDCYWLNRMLDQPVNEELLREFSEEKSVFYKVAWNRQRNNGDNSFTLYNYLQKHNKGNY